MSALASVLQQFKHNQKVAVNTVFQFLSLLLFVFGGIVISSFIIALIWGVFIGTYSSLYVASPVLTYLKSDNREVGKKKEIN